MTYPTKPIYKIARDTRLLTNPCEAEDGLILTKDGVEYYNLKYFNVRRKSKYLIFMDYIGFLPICQYEKIYKKIPPRPWASAGKKIYIRGAFGPRAC